MISLSESSRLPSLTGDAEGDHELYIAGEPWTNDAKDIAYEFTEDTGGARLTFTSRRPMSHLIDRKVELLVGYGGHMLPLFTGELTRPMPDTPTFTSRAVALGPFSAMLGQQFNEQVNYSGFELARALFDISKRAYVVNGRVLIQGGQSKTVEEHIFAEELTLMEGARALTEPAEYVMTDLGDGRRFFLPKPRPGANGKSKGLYQPSDYGTFQPEETAEGPYARVVVFRKGSDEGGQPTYEARGEAEVPNPLTGRVPKRGRTYYVTDFQGNSVEARQTAQDIATRLASGEKEWTMTGVAIDPELRRYDQIQIQREIEEYDGWFRELYDATVDKGFSGNIPDWSMEPGGFALLRSRFKIGAVRIDLSGLGISPGVMDSNNLPDAPITAPYGIDFTGFWFDSPSALVGIDSGGFYVEDADPNTGIDAGGLWFND